MYNLLRRKIIFSFLLVVGFSAASFAQFTAKGNYNYLDFANKPYYFGMSFAYVHAGYRVDKSKAFINNTNINVVESVSGPGVSLNMIANLKVGDYFDFRVMPGFSFIDRSFIYTSTDDDRNTYEKGAESVFFDMPFQLRFKSAPYKDKRFYLMAGLRYSYDVESTSNIREEEQKDLILFSPHDFQLEYGAGIQFFFPFFIFSPEIKISQGISDIHIYRSDLEESSILETIKSKIFSISFHFEG
jgi:hypothetical protein